MNTLRSLIALALFVLVLAPFARAEEHGEKKEHEAEAAPEPESSGPSDRYVHKWIPFPTATGASLPKGDGQQKLEPTQGRMTILVFLASWCEPCQQLLPRLRDLEKRFTRAPSAVDFHYVFVHDTLDDAGGFMKEFGIKQAVLGNTEILKTFHNPDLPTIYVGDRHGWLTRRYIKAGPDAAESLDDFLKYLAAY